MYKTLVSFDGSTFFKFFFLSFFPPSSEICGTVMQASCPNGEPFCWNCAEDNLVFVFPHPKTPSIHVFLSSFWHIFFYSFSPVVLQRKTQIFPVQACHLQTVPYYDFYSLTHNHVVISLPSSPSSNGSPPG